MKIPKDFGEALGVVLFDESQQTMCDFAVDFCNDHPRIREAFQGALEDIAQVPDEKTRKSLKWYIETFPDFYWQSLLTLGFALGQAYEVPDSKVQKDIDFVWKAMKERSLFSMYPKRKKAA